MAGRAGNSGRRYPSPKSSVVTDRSKCSKADVPRKAAYSAATRWLVLDGGNRALLAADITDERDHPIEIGIAQVHGYAIRPERVPVAPSLRFTRLGQLCRVWQGMRSSRLRWKRRRNFLDGGVRTRPDGRCSPAYRRQLPADVHSRTPISWEDVSSLYRLLMVFIGHIAKLGGEFPTVQPLHAGLRQWSISNKSFSHFQKGSN